VDLTGERVTLRALRREDAQVIAANIADPEVIRFVGGWAAQPYAIHQAVEYATEDREGSISWAVERRSDGAMVGTTGLRALDRQNRNCHWGITLGPPSVWDQGLGSEACVLVTRFALQELGMEKVYLEVFEGNDRARRAYEKSGYQLEGTFPQDMLIGGRLRTTFRMAAYRDHPNYRTQP